MFSVNALQICCKSLIVHLQRRVLSSSPQLVLTVDWLSRFASTDTSAAPPREAIRTDDSELN